MNNISILKLLEIDKSMSYQAEALMQIVPELTFEPVVEFELGKDIPEIPAFIFNRKGIYFFEMKTSLQGADTTIWFQNFTTIWKEGGVTWVPGIKKRRISAHQTLMDWVPLYLGKSRNVGGKISEHIHQEQGKTTFSMKLQARENLRNEKFRASWIPLDITNYDMIAPAIESSLRDLKNPIVGKQ